MLAPAEITSLLLSPLSSFHIVSPYIIIIIVLASYLIMHVIVSSYNHIIIIFNYKNVQFLFLLVLSVLVVKNSDQFLTVFLTT